MPSPAFYQRLWDAVSQGRKSDSVALDILFDLADRIRAAGHDQAPTAATVVAACEQVQRLAQLRGNPAPTRDDVLDAISSCYVKGAVDAEGRVILALALGLLSGSTVGEVPPAAGLPPIVDDFNARARQLRFRLDDTDAKQAALEVYRDAGDRDRSQFLHLVAFLDVPFATRLAGSDFTGRQAGGRLQEQWTYAWSPQVDAALIDAASYGNTIREAATNRFIELLQGAEDNGSSRSAAAAVEQLSRACLLGLHEFANRLLTSLRLAAREDPNMVSATAGVSGLVLLWESREPLAAQGIEAVPGLARTCFERACYLMTEGAIAADGEAAQASSALIELRALLAGHRKDWFDEDLFWPAVGRIAADTIDAHPMMAGAAAGILYSAGRWGDQELSRALRGQILGRRSARSAVAYFRGVTLAAREALWQSPTLLATLRDVVEEADEREFVTLLPDLRLAFSTLTPRETDQLGQLIATALGADALGAAVSYRIDPAQVHRNLGISLRLREVLERDGLGAWVAGPAGAAEPS